MNRFDKYTVQALGFALVIMGLVLLILGLLAPPSTSSLAPCPYPGCQLPWYWWIPGASVFSGIGLISVGIVLLIIAARMKPELKTGSGEGAP